ncbi:MAG: TRAFAC clade GTPase domain-containing protein [Thermoplasmataceae archaeon]
MANNGYIILSLSPFYTNTHFTLFINQKYSFTGNLQRNFSGIFIILAIYLSLSGLRSRIDGFKWGNSEEVEKMARKFRIASLFLFLSFLLFTISLSNIKTNFYPANINFTYSFWIVSWLLIILLLASFQHPKFYNKNVAYGSPAFQKPSPNKVQSIAPVVSQQNTPQQVKQNINIRDSTKIGLIGPVAAGKTTLLAYFIHFLRDTTSVIGIDYAVVEGQEYYQKYLDSLLKSHTFPQSTAIDSRNSITIKFWKSKMFGKNEIFLEVSDNAGELFSKNTINADIKKNAFERLSRASGYLFIIDCEKYKDWTTEDLTYTSILHDLIQSGRGKRAKKPIAFVFTKSDLLPEAVYNLSAADLLRSLPNTYNYVVQHFFNPASFKIFIKTERNPTGEIVPKLDVLAGGRLDIRFDPTVNEGFSSIVNWLCEMGHLLK